MVFVIFDSPNITQLYSCCKENHNFAKLVVRISALPLYVSIMKYSLQWGQIGTKTYNSNLKLIEQFLTQMQPVFIQIYVLF